MDGDLISRKAILEAIDKREGIVQKLTANVDDEAEMTVTLSAVREFVRNRPAVDAVPVKRARWKPSPEPYVVPICSRCGKQGFVHWVACPHCGAKMDGGGD